MSTQAPDRAIYRVASVMANRIHDLVLHADRMRFLLTQVKLSDDVFVCGLGGPHSYEEERTLLLRLPSHSEEASQALQRYRDLIQAELEAERKRPAPAENHDHRHDHGRAQGGLVPK